MAVRSSRKARVGRAIKTKRPDVQVEKQIAIGAVVSSEFLRSLSVIYKEDFMLSRYARTVVGWCMEYFNEYDEAPVLHIKDVYDSNVRSGLDEDLASLIHDFLVEISDEYERSDRFNYKYVTDQAEEYFQKRSLKLLQQDIATLLGNGESSKALQLVREYRRPESAETIGIDPYLDEEAIRQAFEDAPVSLVQLPGALGEFMNDELVREGFVAFQAPEKRGKTFMLLEIAHRALRNRCNVAYFAIGDMSTSQVLRRQHIRLSGKPFRKKYIGRYLKPVLDCVHNQDNTCKRKNRACRIGLDFDPDEGKPDLDEMPEGYSACSYCEKCDPKAFEGTHWYEEDEIEETITWREAVRRGEKFMKTKRGKRFKLSCHSSSDLNIAKIREILDHWESTEGFIPDVIVIDYADVLRPEPGQREYRHQQNETWKAMRALSQDRHCLVMTATQSDIAARNVRSQTEANFSEDKRKLAHVTAMYALNQLFAEKKMGLLRIGALAVREDEFFLEKEVVVLQNLRIGRPILGSYFPSHKKAS